MRGVDATQDAIVRRARDVRCDVIAHSYGTVCLTAFRRHYPKSVRRCAYVDPVCFLPSFGSYLRYGFDHHLSGWRALFAHLSARANDPREPASFGNLVLASWFVKGDASTQQLMKRLLFPHEAWERGPLGEDDMVVLSGLDEIVGAAEIAARFGGVARVRDGAAEAVAARGLPARARPGEGQRRHRRARHRREGGRTRAEKTGADQARGAPGSPSAAPGKSKSERSARGGGGGRESVPRVS